jgi:hypothetical protein
MHQLAKEIRDPSIRAAYDATLKGSKAPHVSLGDVRRIVLSALDPEKGKGRAVLNRISEQEEKDLNTIALHLLENKVQYDHARCKDGLVELTNALEERRQSLLSWSEHLRAAAILEDGRNVGSIRFTIDATTYTENDYRRIGRRIRRGDITVHEMPTNLGINAVAYHPAWKTLSLLPQGRFDSHLLYEASILHEATHAIQDFRDKTIPRWNYEVAAYLVEAIMLVKRGPQISLPLRVNALPFFRHARDAARAILERPPDAVKYRDGLNALRSGIGLTPEYQARPSQQFGPDADLLLDLYFTP